METFVKYVLPYIVTLLTTALSGLITYTSAIKKSKMDNDVRIKEIREQHKSELELQKETFRLEMEKMNLQHRNDLEKFKIESKTDFNNNLTTGIVSSILENPKNISELLDLKEKINELNKKN